MTLRETPSQTAGPYVHIGCIPTFAGLPGVYPQDLGASPVKDGAQGRIITITGHVFDGTGAPLLDAMLESWQADAAGRYPGDADADPNVTGFARFATDGKTGQFRLRTVKPGPAGNMAPHIALWITARGINLGLQTRIYFDDDANGTDPVLSQIDNPDRARTLLALPEGPETYRFDIHLQGPRETVFFTM